MGRKWAMPKRWTFKIRRIKVLLLSECQGLYAGIETWIDPFAGKLSPVQYEYKNDLNTEMNTKYHLDALEFLKTQDSNKFDGLLYDPPYSLTQARENYHGYGFDKLELKPSNMKYWSECKNEAARIIKQGGKCICFGWNSNGLGKNRGFEMNRILLVAHGGSQYDTIVTVETKRTT